MMPILLSRRRLLQVSLAAAAVCDYSLLPAQAIASRLSVEVYIWQQLLGRQHRTIEDGLPEIFADAEAAGFHNIELSDVFFTTELRDRTLFLLSKHHLQAPSVYVHGAMHDEVLYRETEQRALNVLSAAKPAGCRAIVCNPEPKSSGEKTDQELERQAAFVNDLGRELAARGAELRIHSHKVEFQSAAREWRSMLRHTDAKLISICLDIDWIKQAGQDPMEFLREAGPRVAEIHVRSSRKLVWQESVEGGGDVDYHGIQAFLVKEHLAPLVVVELAYADATPVTRPLVEDLRRSRLFVEQTFS